MRLTERSAWLFVAVATVLAAGCASVPGPSPGASAGPPAANLDLQAAALSVSDDLAQQLGNVGGRRVVVDPLLERVSGQQTLASRRVQDEVMAAMRGAMPGATVQELDARGADQTGLVATGTLGAGPAADHYVVQIALTDRTSGIVVAQAAARFLQPGLDQSPTAFYSDSPSLVRDRSVDGYLRTAETPVGTQADSLYVEQLPTSALVAAALEAYNAGDWPAALSGYTAAASRDDGQNLRTFNGLYLTNLRLGRTADAEQAFGRIVALGLATNNLAVKLLFRPGTTEFLSDSMLAGAYPMWLRQIARAASASRICLNITGHTSASGTDAVNEPLSLARATAVQALLARDAPGIQQRSRVTGAGSRFTEVGTGADNASDAIDRRVEFAVVPCGP